MEILNIPDLAFCMEWEPDERRCFPIVELMTPLGSFALNSNSPSFEIAWWISTADIGRSLFPSTALMASRIVIPANLPAPSSFGSPITGTAWYGTRGDES